MSSGDYQEGLEPIKPSGDGKIIDYDFIEMLFRKAIVFNEVDEPGKGQFLIDEIEAVRDVLREVPGVKGIFGLGYPFYSFDQNQPFDRVHPVPEISRYVAQQAELIGPDSEKNIGKWVCAVCQEHSDLPDLKTFCRPCEMVGFKPRDLFKAMPDLDFMVVVNKLEPDVLADISNRLGSSGFAQSDTDIFRSVMATDHALDLALGIGRETEEVPHGRSLPVDVHVIDLESMLFALDQVSQFPESRAEVRPQSLRRSWAINPEAINIGFAFIFSLTALDHRPDSELGKALAEARQAYAEWQDGQIESPSSLIVRRSERVNRILSSPVLRAIFDTRIQSWREHPISGYESGLQ